MQPILATASYRAVHGPHGSEPLAHLPGDKFEKRRIPYCIMRVTLTLSPLFFIFSQNLQQKNVLCAILGLLGIICQFVCKCDHSNGSNGISITCIVPDSDVHRTDPIKDFMGDIFQCCFSAKSPQKPFKRIFANGLDNWVFICHNIASRSFCTAAAGRIKGFCET